MFIGENGVGDTGRDGLGLGEPLEFESELWLPERGRGEGRRPRLARGDGRR